MSIDDLTIGEAKQLASIFTEAPKNSSILNNAIGEYVIVRSRNEGINAGLLFKADETGCVLKDARRIWYHKPKDNSTAWYEGVAQTGLHKESKLSCEVFEKYIIEDYSITICSDESIKSIKEHPSHES